MDVGNIVNLPVVVGRDRTAGHLKVEGLFTIRAVAGSDIAADQQRKIIAAQPRLHDRYIHAFVSEDPRLNGCDGSIAAPGNRAAHNFDRLQRPEAVGVCDERIAAPVADNVREKSRQERFIGPDAGAGIRERDEAIRVSRFWERGAALVRVHGDRAGRVGRHECSIGHRQRVAIKAESGGTFHGNRGDVGDGHFFSVRAGRTEQLEDLSRRVRAEVRRINSKITSGMQRVLADLHEVVQEIVTRDDTVGQGELLDEVVVVRET